MSGFPEERVRAERTVQPRAGDHSPRGCGAISMMGEGLSRNRSDAPAGAGRQAFTRLRDAGAMPLICPTCQIVFRCIHAAGTFAWGCFAESASSGVAVGLLAGIKPSSFRRG